MFIVPGKLDGHFDCQPDNLFSLLIIGQRLVTALHTKHTVHTERILVQWYIVVANVSLFVRLLLLLLNADDDDNFNGSTLCV